MHVLHPVKSDCTIDKNTADSEQARATPGKSFQGQAGAEPQRRMAPGTQDENFHENIRYTKPFEYIVKPVYNDRYELAAASGDHLDMDESFDFDKPPAEEAGPLIGEGFGTGFTGQNTQISLIAGPAVEQRARDPLPADNPPPAAKLHQPPTVEPPRQQPPPQQPGQPRRGRPALADGMFSWFVLGLMCMAMVATGAAGHLPVNINNTLV